MSRTIEGREVVIRPERRDWSFTLPEQHAIDFINDDYVELSTPHASTTFHFDGISTADPEEAVVLIGPAVAWNGQGGAGGQVPMPTGYPIPEIQEEFERLQARCRDAGGDWQRVNAWAQGQTHEGHLRNIRAELRALERRAAA
jgi:hypothetical protein